MTSPKRPCSARRTASGAALALALALALELALAALIPARPALAQPPLQAAQAREIVAAVPASLPPFFSTTDEGQPRGFAIDLMDRVAELAGYRLRFYVAEDLAKAELALRLGVADVLPGYGISPERQNIHRFTRPFEFQPVHIFFRASSPPLETLADLAGKRVVLVRNSIPHELLADEPDINVHLVDTLADGIFHTLSGETEALVFQAGHVGQALAKAGLEDALARSARPLFEVGRAIAVRQDREELARDLDAALERFRNTEEFNALYAKWHAAPARLALPPELAWAALGLAVALAASLLAWRYVSILRVNRRLSQALGERDHAMASLRLTEERLNSLLTLANMDAADTDEVIGFALEEGVRLTGSQMGYLCFLAGGVVDLAQFHWSREAQRLCAMPRPPEQTYPLERAGLWAECLATKAPAIVNDYPAHPGKRGLPEGHAPVLRHMAVPVLEGEDVVAVLGVGNKPEPYDEADARQLQLFLTGLWRIIQARKSAKALRQAKEYAENLIQNANAMAIGVDRDCNVTLLNAAATETTGYTLEDVQGRNWFDLTRTPEEAAGLKERFRKYMSGELPLPRRHEARLRTKDGRIRFITAQNSLLRQDGSITGLLSFAIDITERRNTERALAESEEKFRALAEDSPALICRFLPGGEITYVNTAYCRAFGRKAEDLVGTSFLDLVPGSEHEAIRAHFLALTPERPTRTYEHQVLTVDGGLAWQSWTDRAVFDAAGAVTAYQSVGMDITARKQAEEELERLRQAIEEAAEGVVITDRAGRILFRNPAFARMTGLEDSTALDHGRSILELAQDELGHQDSMLQQSAQSGTWRGGIGFRRPDGTLVEAELTVSAIRDGGGAVTSYVAVCRDVTEKKRLERQLWQAQKMEALGTLAGGIAHDFNNILASIMGFTELALEDTPAAGAGAGPGGGRARQSLERVLRASRRAKELVRQILSFSRRGESEPAVLRADAVLAEALKLMEATLPKHVSLTVEPGAGDCAVLADASQLHQIVMNLCTNAAQAMRERGGAITVTTARREFAEDLPASRGPLPRGGYLEITVADDGPGIPPDIQPRIFDPFFTTKGSGEGTGLGLAVVHGIVSSLGGDISVESAPGRGARFTVLLPEAHGQPAPERLREQAGQRGRGRILFVDDEPDILDLASLSLGGLGYDVSVRSGPEDALKSFQDSPQDFDLVVSDQNMPGMPGTALAARLRQIRPGLPLVLSSGLSEVIPPEHIEALGQVRLLPKPYSMSELAEAVRLALAKPQGDSHGQPHHGG